MTTTTSPLEALPNPDEVMSAEYRALYEHMEELELSGYNAIVMQSALSEIIDWAKMMRTELSKQTNYFA